MNKNIPLILHIDALFPALHLFHLEHLPSATALLDLFPFHSHASRARSQEGGLLFLFLFVVVVVRDDGCPGKSFALEGIAAGCGFAGFGCFGGGGLFVVVRDDGCPGKSFALEGIAAGCCFGGFGGGGLLFVVRDGGCPGKSFALEGTAAGCGFGGGGICWFGRGGRKGGGAGVLECFFDGFVLAAVFFWKGMGEFVSWVDFWGRRVGRVKGVGRVKSRRNGKGKERGKRDFGWGGGRKEGRVLMRWDGKKGVGSSRLTGPASEVNSRPIALASLSQGRDVGFRCSMMASSSLTLVSSSHLTIFAVID